MYVKKIGTHAHLLLNNSCVSLRKRATRRSSASSDQDGLLMVLDLVYLRSDC